MHTNSDRSSSSTIHLKYMNSNYHYRLPFLRKRFQSPKKRPTLISRDKLIFDICYLIPELLLANIIVTV